MVQDIAHLWLDKDWEKLKCPAIGIYLISDFKALKLDLDPFGWGNVGTHHYMCQNP